MSKMDNLRAMREAKYDANAKRASGKAPAPKKPAPVAPAAPTSSAAPAGPATDGTAAAEALCGHRNMSGRTCTREAGHAAKSHRYS